GANVAIDVVGYFSAPSGNGGMFFMQGGNAFGTTARLGTLDSQPLEVAVANQRALRIEPGVTSPNWIAGFANNGVYPSLSGVTVGGGGAPGVRNDFILPGDFSGDLCRLQYGCINGVLDAFGTVSGGAGNLAGAGTAGVQGQAASVGGGVSNWAYAAYSAVAGGTGNTASGYSSAVVGGSLNSATNQYAVALGGNGNHANGLGSVTVGGLLNTADSDNTLAAGTHAIARAVGEFVWSDYAENGAPFDPSLAPPYGWGANADNTFNVRATGGVWFVTAVDGLGRATWGCTLTSGSNIFCSSDRNLKRNLAELDGIDVLAKLVAMPVYAWQPKDGPNANDRHIGPMAQDFYANFGLGHTDKAIGLQDEAGVALAAIRGLHRIVEAKDARIDALERRLDAQERTMEEQRRLMQSQREAIANMRRTIDSALTRVGAPVIAEAPDIRFDR
ncbi:MAG TPA: tail fiber domain-containing protein, partial [Casimicrobiaceae bacterium]|nr:tail fiber domain-containing protein [Casimicrobiaceae bacterium]